MKFAMLKGIIKVHWPEQTEKGDIGLHFAADKLCQNLNPNKVDFYPAERLVEVVLTAMTLNYIRYSRFPLPLPQLIYEILEICFVKSR